MALYSSSEGNSSDRCNLVILSNSKGKKNPNFILDLSQRTQPKPQIWFTVDKGCFTLAWKHHTAVFYQHANQRWSLHPVRTADRSSTHDQHSSHTNNNLYFSVYSNFDWGENRTTEELLFLERTHSTENKIKQNHYQRSCHLVLWVLLVSSCVPWRARYIVLSSKTLTAFNWQGQFFTLPENVGWKGEIPKKDLMKWDNGLDICFIFSFELRHWGPQAKTYLLGAGKQKALVLRSSFYHE